ncbi:MAG: hypothetical protein KBT46_00930 [Ruminococcus sp.]|nr:hypothetical protein [Candidatus Copronaster equi]
MEKKTLKTSVNFFAILFTYVLVDKYGFGERKMKQVMTTVTRLAEELAGNDIKLKEITDMLSEEYGIKFKS